MKLLATITDKEVTGKDVNFSGDYSLRAAARAILLNSQNKIAILHSAKHGFHKLPGGGVEGTEDIKETLKRELREETGCNSEITGEIGKIIEIKNEYGQKQTSYCFIARTTSEGKASLTKEESDLMISLTWVSLDEAIKLLESDFPEDYTAKFIRARDLVFLKEFASSKTF